MFCQARILQPLKRTVLKLCCLTKLNLTDLRRRIPTLSAIAISFYLLYKDMEYMYRLRNRTQYSLALVPSSVGGGGQDVVDTGSAAASSQQPSADHRHPITVKLTMMFATLQFVDMPLAWWTLEWFPLQNFVGANSVSILGIFFSVVAFFMLLSDKLGVRQSGFIFFRIREYLDSLDGYVARKLSRDSAAAALTVDFHSFGSYVDRVADGIGYLFVGFGLIGYLFKSSQQRHRRRTRFNDNNNGIYALDNKVPPADYHRLRHPGISPEAQAGLLVGIQMIYASVLWNYFTVVLSDIFESSKHGQSPEQDLLRVELFSSGSTCVLFYLWKNLNHQGLMHVWLVASIYDRCLEYADIIKYVGFSFLTLAGFVSFLYTKYLIYRIENVDTAAA